MDFLGDAEPPYVNFFEPHPPPLNRSTKRKKEEGKTKTNTYLAYFVAKSGPFVAKKPPLAMGLQLSFNNVKFVENAVSCQNQ